MSNPSVTAVIRADDQASATIKAIAQLVQNVGKHIENMGQGRNSLGSHFEQANAAAEKHISTLHRVSTAMKNLSGAAATYAAFKMPDVASDAIRHYIPVEREMVALKAAGNYSAADMEKLRAQQTDLATKYGEKPESVVHAQGEFVRRHMDAETAKAMTEQAAILGKAVGTSVQEAAKIVEGSIFGSGKHVENPEDARRLGNYYSDRLTRAAKSGAMSPADLDAFNKYAAAPINASGMRYEQGLGLGMILKREQFGGDESGIFMRQLSARLMSPTAEGRIALNSVGLNYGDYAKAGQLSGSKVNLALGEAFGKELSKSSIENIDAKVKAGAIATKRDWQKAVVAAYVSDFGDQKAGDLKKLANTSGKVFEVSKTAVDGARLLDDMMARFSPQQMLAYLGVKQGSKGASAVSQLAAWRDNVKQLEELDGLAKKIAEERMQGLAAAVDRLSASLDATKNAFVESNSSWLQSVTNAGTAALKWGAGLDDNAKQIATFGTAIGLGTAAIATMVRTWQATSALISLATKGLPVAAEAPAAANAATPALASALPFLATPAGALLLAGGALGAIAAMTPEARKKELTDAADGPNLLRLNPKTVILGDGAKGALFDPSAFQTQRRVAEVDGEDALRLAHIHRLTNDARRPTFGIEGPVAPRQLPTDLSGSQAGQPVKVDTNVHGEVSGAAEIHNSTTLTIEPSAYFAGLVHKVESATNLLLSGKLGQTESGSNAAKAATPVFNGVP